MSTAQPNKIGDERVRRPRGAWPDIIRPTAAAIVKSYDTGVTLRQLFYRLVSLPHDHPARLYNTLTEYTALAGNSADWRRESNFPELVDQTREITGGGAGYESPQQYIAEMLDDAADYYSRNPTENQPYQIWLGTEKSGLVNQLRSWFSRRGLHIISLGGYASQGYVTDIVRTVRSDGRPAVLLYAGDHDPTGWSILQNFVDRTGCWSGNRELRGYNPRTIPRHRGDKKGHKGKRGVIPNYDLYRKYKVALTPEQCVQYKLPRNYAKEADNNLNTFGENFNHTLTDAERALGRGVQIEVDALEPTTLRDLFTQRIDKYWDAAAFEAMQAQERADLAELGGIIERLRDNST
jgi:hypothetical protein